MNRASHTPTFIDRFLGLIENTPPSDRLFIRVSLFFVIFSSLWLLIVLSQHFATPTPTAGGDMTEGIIGTPRFINPALAITRTDQDVTALVYSGLLRLQTDGSLGNDLAKNIIISNDGLTYNVVLRSDITFHDGTPITAHDVAYTIHLIQNAELKSPLRGNWIGVTVEEVSDSELNIVLPEAYAPFLENFTIGIMPAHLWSNLPIEQLPFSQLNTEPVGSGPYTITTTKRDTSGLITDYTLTAYDQSDAPRAKIETINLRFFQNETALETALTKGELDATAYLPLEKLSALDNKTYRLLEVPLPRTFGIFFNQNKEAALRDIYARQALALMVDRGGLIENAESGYGVPSTEPIFFATTTVQSESITDTSAESRLQEAASVLESNGWRRNHLGLWEKKIGDETATLSLTIRTGNDHLFDTLLDDIVARWRMLGVEVTTEQFEQSDLVQSVIRPRDFEALLFGFDVGRSRDLYPFWHSSQQNDPGLNIAQYANVEVDRLLEEARTEQSSAERLTNLTKASSIIASEYPAIFLFQPELTYVINQRVQLTTLTEIGRPSDRFSNISEWYTNSETLWPLFR